MSDDKISKEEQDAIKKFLNDGGKVKQMPTGERSIPLDSTGSNFYRRKKSSNSQDLDETK